MEIKLFGRSLFEVKKSRAEAILGMTAGVRKESKYLLDFHNLNQNNSPLAMWSPVAIPAEIPKKKKKEPPELTPKGIYELKMLHEQTFNLNTDPAYVDGQVADFKDKLALIKSEEFDMTNGVNEVASILSRLENRKKYAEVQEFFEQYPYTTSSKIQDLIKAHEYLKLGHVAQFMADMPKEATDTMKAYNEHTKKVCDKQAVFYIIAKKKDFEKTERRRDPILLAQSPFGHFWQILGAWDEEMLLVEEL